MSKKGKIGDGHLKAAAVQGVHEIRNAFYPESNIAEKHSPYGIWGSPTPGEVSDARGGDDRGIDGASPRSFAVDDRLNQAAHSFEAPDIDSPDLDLDMGG